MKCSLKFIRTIIARSKCNWYKCACARCSCVCVGLLALLCFCLVCAIVARECSCVWKLLATSDGKVEICLHFVFSQTTRQLLGKRGGGGGGFALNVDRSLVSARCEWSTWMHFRFDDCLLSFLCSSFSFTVCLFCVCVRACVWLNQPQSSSSSICNTEIERFYAFSTELLHYCTWYRRTHNKIECLYDWRSGGEQRSFSNRETTRINNILELCVDAALLKLCLHHCATEKDPSTSHFCALHRPIELLLPILSIVPCLVYLALDTSNRVKQHCSTVAYQFSLGAFFPSLSLFEFIWRDYIVPLNETTCTFGPLLYPFRFIFTMLFLVFISTEKQEKIVRE